MTDATNNSIPGFTTNRVGDDYTILTPEEKKARVFQSVTSQKGYDVGKGVLNRTIDQINAIRANRLVVIQMELTRQI